MVSLIIKSFFFLLEFDNKECFLIDFGLYTNIVGNLSYFHVKIEKDSSTNLQIWSAARGRWEVLISLTFKLLMLSNNLENFLMLSNCVQFIVFHLIYLGLHHFLSFFFSLEGCGSRSDWSFDFLCYRKSCLLALLQDEIRYPLLKYMFFRMIEY